MSNSKFRFIIFCSVFFFFNVTNSFAQAPVVAAFAFQPSCVDGVVQSNGYLQISETDVGDAYHWSLGSTFDDNGGADTYANATSLAGATFPIQFGAFANPNVSQDYTVRVYNGSNTVFTDVVVTMNEQDCLVGCNCEDVLYLNDTDLDEVHKFSINSSTGVLTEIGSPWADNVLFPHGVASDINGDVYFTELTAGTGTKRIYKTECDGTIIDNNFLGTELTAGNLGTVTNMAIVDDVLYANDLGGLEINAFDIFTQSLIGTVSLGGASGNTWGMTLGPDGFLYATSSRLNNAIQRVYKINPDISNFTSPATTVNPLFTFDVNAIHGSNTGVAGIAVDENSNIYVVAARNGKTTLIKFDQSGNVLGTIVDDTSNGTGFRKAIGLTYSEALGHLYITSPEDCISVIDAATLTALPALSIPQAPGSTPKGIATGSECCPTNNNMVIDTSLCDAMIGDITFLADYINCESGICEGEWSPSSVDNGITYNPGNNSITIDSLGTCGSFILESDGTGNNLTCGAFKITVNICAGCYDFGDLPDTGAGTGTLNYETLTAFSGPSHIIIPGLTIGSTIDPDLDGQASFDALGDGADEDGFTFPANLDLVPGGTINLPIDVINTTSNTAHYEIWIDWNGDGDFNDANEMVADLSDNGAGNFGQPSITINIPNNVAEDQPLGFRARLSHTDNMTPLGDVASGEVEDYIITVSCNPQVCLPVGIIKN